MNYLTLAHRTPDSEYRNLLQRILKEGRWTLPQQGERAIGIIGHLMRFSMKNGFPIITERDIVSDSPKGGKSVVYQALGEMFAFLNGEHTQEGLEKYGCTWWKRWVTERKCQKRGLETGDLGPGSYGSAFRAFPKLDGTSHDQITGIFEQMREFPHLRTHFISPWIPQYILRGEGKQQKVVVAPCHGWMHFYLFPETKQISLHHSQRSGDTPVGIAANLVQYAAILLMAGEVLGYEPDELVYEISDAHIYEKQIKDVEEMLATKPQKFPLVQIINKKDSIFDFRQEDFSIEDYNPQLPWRRIWTPE